MAPKVLSDSDVEQFIECGYTRLPEAFPAAAALAAQDYLWDRLAELGVRRSDPSTWARPMVHIKDGYDSPEFRACATERLADAVEDLIGTGRWAARDFKGYWGWWPVNFAVGAETPWTVPIAGWHWDGQDRVHRADSPEQGLLLLCVFSETGPRGGGTLVAEGSHQVVARFLRQFPDGLPHPEALRRCPDTHPWLAELLGKGPRSYDGEAGDGVTEAQPAESPAAQSDERVDRFMHRTHVDEHGTRLRVVEITASPGDVFLCHPFLYHAASQNHSGRPRFMCNRSTPLKERMRFDRPDGAHSPLEMSIKRAIAL